FLSLTDSLRRYTPGTRDVRRVPTVSLASGMPRHARDDARTKRPAKPGFAAPIPDSRFEPRRVASNHVAAPGWHDTGVGKGSWSPTQPTATDANKHGKHREKAVLGEE